MRRYIVDDDGIVIDDLLANTIETILHKDQLTNMVFVRTGFHFEFQGNRIVPANNHSHILRHIKPVIQPGEEAYANQCDHCGDHHQYQHGHRRNYHIGDQAQLPVGDKISNKQRDPLAQQGIQPPQIAELKAVKSKKQHQYQQTVNTGQHIFAVTDIGGEQVAVIAATPSDVVSKGKNQNFQNTFQTPN